MPRPEFVFALDEVLAAITPRTRVVFLTNPNNPTGVSMPMEDIRTIARRVPAGAIVFVDEAYADFAGATFIPELRRVSERDRRPHVLEGARPGGAADRRAPGQPPRRSRRFAGRFPSTA